LEPEWVFIFGIEPTIEAESRRLAWERGYSTEVSEVLAPDLWASLAPDFELHGRPDVPDVTVYRGREASKEFWRMLQEVWAELRWEPRGFTDLGHAIVVETKIVARGRGSDVRIEADETDVFWFRDGAIVRLQGFPTTADALEAARVPL
jgi:ketosteroid isomerase-like protein